MHLKKWFKQRGLARLIMEPQQLANKSPNTLSIVWLNCKQKREASMELSVVGTFYCS